MTDVAVKRPTLVTVIAVLTIIAAVVSLLAGFVWLFLPPDASVESTWRLIGIGYLICGLGLLWVARGLMRGDPRSRIVFVVLVVFNLILTFLGATQSSGAKGLSFLDVVLAAVAVIIVYTPKANAFFGRGVR